MPPARSRSTPSKPTRKNNDRVTVFDGTMEVRTPARTTRVREGEEARIDDGGIYDLVSARNTADEFERWFIQRASRYSTASGRYLDRSLAYSEAELGTSGSWFFAANFGGWCWRPHVAAGWRPYYNGYWRHSPGGVLVWVSYDPWGWVPYHYGRWAYEAGVRVGVAAGRRVRAGVGLLDVRPELHRLGADGLVRLLSPVLRLGVPAVCARRIRRRLGMVRAACVPAKSISVRGRSSLPISS